MNTKSFLAILALIVTFLAGGSFLYVKSGDQVAATVLSASLTSESSAAEEPLALAVPVSSNYSYKDGTYSATGNFSVPEGKTESVSVSVTLKNGVIVDSSVTGTLRDHESRRYVQQFISGYKKQVIGKSIDEVHLNTVSGSSLTGKGWNSAIESIKSQAAV